MLNILNNLFIGKKITECRTKVILVLPQLTNKQLVAQYINKWFLKVAPAFRSGLVVV